VSDEEAPKSAYELAMARLRQKDKDAGIEEKAATEEQKAKIAEIRKFYEAKLDGSASDSTRASSDLGDEKRDHSRSSSGEPHDLQRTSPRRPRDNTSAPNLLLHFRHSNS